MKTLLLTIFLYLFCTILQAQVKVTQVKDINPTGDSRPYGVVTTGEKLFFIAYDGNAYRLGVSGGTAVTTALLTPADAQNIQPPVAFNNKAYFSCNDNVNGQELWVSDGTEAGTKMLIDLYAGSTGSFPQSITAVNNKLFFLANNTDGGTSLYVSDGTAAGTTVLRDGFNVNFNGTTTFVVYKNSILFKTNDGTSSDGLWISDGTVAGTQPLVKGLVPGNAAGNSVTLNNQVYFTAADNDHGAELWVSDGTTAGTYMVKNISPDEPSQGVYGNSTPQAFCVYGNKVYFSATDGEHGQELWVSDGTEANTRMVKDVIPGSTGSLPYHSIVYNNKLYFICWNLQQLWVSDGTEANTVEVAPVHDYSQFAAIWNGLMYLESPQEGDVLQSDGTAAGTVDVKASNTSSLIYYNSTDYYFTVMNNELYFSASVYGLTNGAELVKLSNGALPLTLLSFNGQIQKDNDVLTWQTSSEINTDYFEVQQAANVNNFTTVGNIAAAGNGSDIKNYSFSQKSVLNPAGYYRLKMVDKNGDFNYSRAIKLPRANTGDVKAFYNNATRQITIQNNTNSNCTWQLFNAAGSIIKKGSSSDGVINIPAGDTAGGVYILSCISNAGRSTFKLPLF